ncbi:MAG TPA: hypothetical protein VN437_07220, partial [Rectinemataceae bacterium]|nr:hypothetical protein [Rectinemataceae bacterium]
ISSGNDLYLISHRGDDTISYRIENEKETILELVGNITLGRLDSIELFHGAPVPGEAFQVIRKNGVKEYTVREGETVVGTIKERKEGLDYRDADGRLIYTADFSTGSVCEEEESVADIVAVVTLTPRLGRAKKDILLIKGPEGEIAGKYYYALRNLELALDGSRAADRHIAAVLAIMADTKLQLAK